VCGIAGVFDSRAGTSAPELTALVEDMSSSMFHRGPDAGGSWVDAPEGLALGSRRLAILDLTDAGSQPMRSASGRWIVVFNGLIYNHRELRARLVAEGSSFRGTSDTEVLVEAIDRWGVPLALERCNGMFAFGAWDREGRRLVLARDRLGEKPLYYGWAGDRFAFASELGALRRLPGFDTRIDPVALAGYLRLTHVPAPHTIHLGARTLGAGELLELRTDQLRSQRWPTPTRWFSVDDVIGEALAAPFEGDEQDAGEALGTLLADAVATRLDSDVPLGCFLSGGYDSSIVTALAVAADRGPVRTFTVRMPELGFDESADAAKVAAHLGTDHQTIDLSVNDALATIPRLPQIYGEPFGDPSALPTALVCAAARTHVTVALGGDGGDEMFVGYNRYVLGDALWQRVRRMPRPLRRALGELAALPPPGLVDRIASRGPRRFRVRNPGDKLQKGARLLQAADESGFAAALVEEWRPEEILADRVAAPGDPPGGPAELLPALVRRDLLTTLPDQMLVKVDRASMAASLEVRSPLLDHRLLTLAWSVPFTWHVREGAGKQLLRRVVNDHVPPALLDRPKMGFDPPIGTWLRGPLRPWASDLLDARSVAAAGLRPDAVARRWDEHRSGRVNHDYALWTVLQYLAWRDSA